MSPLDTFAPAVRTWFAQAFAAPTRAQVLGWPEIQSGRSTLIFAPTGSGKTLAAFLCAIDRLMFAAVPKAPARCRVVYVSPLRALAVDVERNLRAPLVGIAAAATERGDAFHVPTMAIRTGDTPANERAKMARTPPDILITTPESLYLILSSKARAMLASVEVVIVDEIHALVATKRGVHLALSLERLAEVTGRPLQRIGLSATQRPLAEVARYLGGGRGQRPWKRRPVSIVDAGSKKAFELRVEMPIEDESGAIETANRPGGETAARADSPAGRRSTWTAIHPRLLELVRAHRSTLVFVNSRRLAERLAGALNQLAGEGVARAHHGSVAREERLEIETALKAGLLPCIVATSSLELGIDMGAIDMVVQIEAPPSVASGLQRIGRGGHQANAISEGVIFPKFRGDLVASAAITRAMSEGLVEETRIPHNPLDVLAQHLVAACLAGPRQADDLLALVRQAAPFAELPLGAFEGVLDMLSGLYPSDEFAELRPRLVWDRRRGTVRAREGALHLVVTNAGTIPDRGLYGVFLADGEGGASAGGPARPGRRVGELDEEMVFESRVGEVFVLGATSWRILEITHDRVLVAPASGTPGKMPFWRADREARPVALGRAIGRLTRELRAAGNDDAVARLTSEHSLDERAAHTLLAYLDDQQTAAGVLPDDRTIVLERTRDEMGDWRLCLLSPFGGRVHAPWALCLEARLRATGEAEVTTVWSDDGIVIRLPDRERPPDAAALLPAPEEIEDLVTRELGQTALFAAHFREAAARALLLPRRRPGRRSPLWMQRKRSADLLSVAARYPSFPIVLEAHRECLTDVFDVPALVDLARQARQRTVRLVTVDTLTPSPFASSLLFGYVANYLYEGDAPLAERRAQALLVDEAQLRELLGEAELRELIDAASLAEIEAGLQGLDPRRRVRSADRVHDLLLRLGDLSVSELAARVEAAMEPDPAAAEARARGWLEELEAEARAVRVQIAGVERFAAAEDAARLRDGLRVALPSGLPQPFLEPVAQPLGDLLLRYARSHGPFHADEPARRFGLDVGVVESALRTLLPSGRLVEGEFRPGGSGREWCGANVLATLRRRSRARLLRETEPVEPEALARMLLDWQGVTGAAPRRPGPDALLDVVEQIQGAAFPASALERDILPARVPGYRPEHLDALCAAGDVVWLGVSGLGERDGRIALYLTDDLWRLHTPTEATCPGAVHERLRAHLGKHGASFFADIFDAVGEALAGTVLDALWDMVFAGEVRNDSLGALRAFVSARSSSGPGRRARTGAFHARRNLPPASAGRWSLVVPPAGGRAPTPTAKAAALGEQLVARHGVLTRGAVAAEELPGGFGAVYPVLRALEEAGRVRRGYFVSGLGGSQFAHPGALERLRARREAAGEDESLGVILAATDPANPYGAALPWPKAEGARPMRAAGTHVAIVDGRLAAYLGRSERELNIFLPADEPARTRIARGVALALARWAATTGRIALGWSTADGTPLATGPLGPFLEEAGFVRSGPGFRLVAPVPATAPAPESTSDPG